MEKGFGFNNKYQFHQRAQKEQLREALQQLFSVVQDESLVPDSPQRQQALLFLAHYQATNPLLYQEVHNQANRNPRPLRPSGTAVS